MIRRMIVVMLLGGSLGLTGAEHAQAGEEAKWQHPLVKRGYLNSPLVEVLPFVFNEELYVLENWRSDWRWPEQPSATAAKNAEMWIAQLPAGPGKWNQRKHLSYAMAGRTLGTVFVWEDRVYVFGVNEASGRKHVDMTWSDDLVTWSVPVKVFDSPAGQIFNVSVARDDSGFVFLWETNGVGTPFTMCFGRIDNISDTWNDNTIADAHYGADKYTGGPAIFYEGGLYYLLYLEHLGGGRFETRVTRSRDLVHWQDAPPDRPFVTFDPGRRNIPLLAPEAVETNASDPGLTYFNGRVIVYYTGSNQQVGGDLQWATFAGTKHEMFERFFEGQRCPLRQAVEHLSATFGDRYPDGPKYLDRLAQLESALAKAPGDKVRLLEDQFEALRREALLANPLLDFDRILLLERGELGAGNPAAVRAAMGSALGMAQNFQTNDNVPRRGRWKDRLSLLSNLRNEPRLETLFAPPDGRTLTDPVLDFSGDTILFAMEGTEQANWRLFEINADGSDLRQVTPDDGADVAHFDPCYLPDGNIIFASTATMMGLPCLFGLNNMASFYRLDRQTGSIRQLTFDQDSSWSPTPLPNGRVLYQRWEYSDTPHSNSRLLCSMNPDGTDQREYWGGGSYFPPSFFYARPVPDHPRKVIGVATGHHGVARSGRLLLVDPGRGRKEAQGVVQEIPGYGKEVEPLVRDRLVDGVWPQFLHPYPLSENYHLVAAKPAPDTPWGIYLVDVFDNMVLLKEAEENNLLWPIPMRETPRPPVIPDRVNLDESEARILVTNVYEGEGLEGIPKGAVDALRIFEYYFSYRQFGGLPGTIGLDGPWDIKRVLGTVPVESDGSAYFSVPANTPISIQALDEQGQALQLMRSWTVAQPGENASCIGCHESMSQSPPASISVAMPAAAQRKPSPIHATWEVPVRGFSFQREVQPVLDRHCVGCHNGSTRENGLQVPYLKGDRRVTDWSSDLSGDGSWPIGAGGQFTESYVQLKRYVRDPGIESDLRMLSPMDYHFNATELGQLLRKGHHGVKLDGESWERLVTWFDLNTPMHGTWGDMVDENWAKVVLQKQERAIELRQRYAPQGPFTDYEHIPELPPFDTTFREPEKPEVEDAPRPVIEGWPFGAEEAKRRQNMAAKAAGWENGPRKTIDMGEGPVFPTAYLGHDDTRPSIEVGPVTLEFVLVPGGRFVMGASQGHPDEYPYTKVEVKPFWMAQFEITNALYRMFAPEHESRDESRRVGMIFGRRGFYQDAPDQPAVRVSWKEAMKFCEWLSEKTGLEMTLPTEAQWEWAARAGADTPFHFGDADSDYSPYANLADRTLQEFAQCTGTYGGNYDRAVPINNPNRFDDPIPRCDTFEDGGLVTVDVGSYRPNPWGLHDMHGNAAEWTRSAYESYPYSEDDGRNDTARSGAERVVRGGSWRDRPHQSTASYRRPYQPYHRVFNVGFRVIMPVNSAE